MAGATVSALSIGASAALVPLPAPVTLAYIPGLFVTLASSAIHLLLTREAVTERRQSAVVLFRLAAGMVIVALLGIAFLTGGDD